MEARIAATDRGISMNETIRLGRVAGVRVGLHWSVLGIVALVSVGMGAYALPRALPGHSWFSYALAGIASAVLLVCSLLAHELAHAIVAQRNRVAVEGITLWLLGGMARLRGDARDPGADLRIAIVGPGTSVAVAAVFGALAGILDQWRADELVVTVAWYLALLNAVLAVFNLVPAAPLDGGRVLHSALWWASGDRFKAAIWSAWAGRGFGFLLIVTGIVLVLSYGVEGLWWILVGWFIVNVASAEEHQARIYGALAHVYVRDVMSSPLDTADGSLTVEQFLRGITSHRQHSVFPVLDGNGRLEGLARLKQVQALPFDKHRATPLSNIVTPTGAMTFAQADEPLTDVLPRLTGAMGGRFLVWRGEELVGIVSPSDINRTFVAHGLHAPSPSGADLVSRTEQPPANWWYPGKDRR